MNSEQFLMEAQKNLRIGTEAAASYVKARDVMLDEVNTLMAEHPQISSLIGGNPLSMMYNNHRNHKTFSLHCF